MAARHHIFKTLHHNYLDEGDVSEVNATTTSLKSNNTSFHVAVLDSGAQRSVIGILQAQMFCREARMNFKLLPSNVTYKFGDECYASRGQIHARIPTPLSSYIERYFDVVSSDIPMLIGLDILYRAAVVANNVNNQLECAREKWSLPITRK